MRTEQKLFYKKATVTLKKEKEIVIQTCPIPLNLLLDLTIEVILVCFFFVLFYFFAVVFNMDFTSCMPDHVWYWPWTATAEPYILSASCAKLFPSNSRWLREMGHTRNTSQTLLMS